MPPDDRNDVQLSLKLQKIVLALLALLVLISLVLFMAEPTYGKGMLLTVSVALYFNAVLGFSQAA